MVISNMDSGSHRQCPPTPLVSKGEEGAAPRPPPLRQRAASARYAKHSADEEDQGQRAQHGASS